MNNRFLDDFVRRQTEVIKMEATPAAAPGKKKKSKYGTKTGEAPFGEQDALTRIITEKPNKKHVLAYFRDRIAQLVAEDTDL